MSLTVPKAGLIAGRAAQPQIEASQAGAAIARFGDVMMQVGTGIENDRLEREMGRLQVDMTRDLNAMRLEFEQMGDPDAIDTLWPQRVAELRSTYMEGVDENGRRRVDPKNADRFSLGFDDLVNRHAFAIGRKTLALRQSQRIANWGDYRATAAPQAATTDPGTREALYANFDAQTDALVASGAMTPEEAAKEKRGFRIETENARIIGMVSDDPTGFLAAADAGEFADTPPEVMARYRVQAQNGIARAEKEAETEAKLEAKERSAAIGKRLGDIANIAGKDRVAVDEVWLSDPEVQAHPDFPKTKAALDLRTERGDLPYLTVPELDALIAEEAARPVTEPFQAERLEVLEGYREKAATGWRRDPIAFAAGNGFKVPDLPAFDPANPDDFRAGLEARVAFSSALQEAGYTRQAIPLTLDEQEALKSAISVEADPAARARLARDLTETIGRGAPGVLTALVDDPVFLHAGGFLAAGGNDGLAREMLRGQQVMDQGNVVMPPAKDRIAPVFDQIGDMFADVPGGEIIQGQIVAAADALYAARSRRLDPAGAVDEDLYNQALHEVLGGTGRYGRGDATGGVAEIGGRLTALPTGVSVDDFEAAVMGLRRDLMGRRLGDDPKATPEDRAARAEKALTGASVSGGMPLIGGARLTPDDWGDAQFIAVGPDQYSIVFQRRGGDMQAVDDQTGEAYVFDLRKLLRGYGR